MGRAAKARRNQRSTRSVRPPVFGVDIGGVLVDRAAENSDTSFFGSRPMETPAAVGSLEALVALAAIFEQRVHIVSKAGPVIARLSREWLAEQGWFDAVPVLAANLHFVRKRSDKHDVCQRLGVTHFVDDRLDVLLHLHSVDCRYLFLGGLGSNQPPVAVPDDVCAVDTWPRLVGILQRDLARHPG